MGNSLSINKVAKLEPSRLFYGHGLVATLDIPNCSYITLVNSEIKSGHMNDVDFEYPRDFSYNTLVKCFNRYIQNCQCSKTNTEWITQTRFKLTRKIAKGEELTKHPGIPKWGVFLALDISGENPSNPKLKPSENKAQDLETLKQVLLKYGATLTILTEFQVT